MELDEFGIPKGEHRAKCGCEFRGRSVLRPCYEHFIQNALLDRPLDFSIEKDN